jgi:hypothetical protein
MSTLLPPRTVLSPCPFPLFHVRTSSAIIQVQLWLTRFLPDSNKNFHFLDNLRLGLTCSDDQGGYSIFVDSNNPEELTTVITLSGLDHMSRFSCTELYCIQWAIDHPNDPNDFIPVHFPLQWSTFVDPTKENFQPPDYHEYEITMWTSEILPASLVEFSALLSSFTCSRSILMFSSLVDFYRRFYFHGFHGNGKLVSYFFRSIARENWPLYELTKSKKNQEQKQAEYYNQAEYYSPKLEIQFSLIDCDQFILPDNINLDLPVDLLPLSLSSSSYYHNVRRSSQEFLFCRLPDSNSFVEQVISIWKYTTSQTKTRVFEAIRKFPSMGIFKIKRTKSSQEMNQTLNQQELLESFDRQWLGDSTVNSNALSFVPVGWCVIRNYSCLSILYINPDYRRLGLASRLIKLLCLETRKYLKKRIIPELNVSAPLSSSSAHAFSTCSPFCFIERDNFVSMKLFQSIGFQRFHSTFWTNWIPTPHS